MKKKLYRVVAVMLAALLLALGCVSSLAEEIEPVATNVDEVPAISEAEAELEQVIAAPEEIAPMSAAAPEEAVPMSAAAPGEVAPMSVDPVEPMGVAIANKQTIAMNVGEVVQLEAALEAPVTWKAKKARIASVDANGVLTANAEGTTSVSAKSGKQTVKIKVQVVDPYKPSAVALDVGKEIQLTLQDTLTLTPILAPETARATFTWKSSKPAVVIVDNGVLYPQKEGVSTITVKTQNKKSAKVKVHVVDPYKPAGVALDVTGTVTLKPGHPHAEPYARHGAGDVHLEVVQARRGVRGPERRGDGAGQGHGEDQRDDAEQEEGAGHREGRSRPGGARIRRATHAHVGGAVQVLPQVHEQVGV